MDGNSVILLQILAINVNQEAMLTAMSEMQLVQLAKSQGREYPELKTSFDENVIRLQGEIGLRMAKLISQLNPDIAQHFSNYINEKSQSNPSTESESE